LRRVIAGLDALRGVDQVVHRPCHSPDAARYRDSDQDDQKDRKEDERVKALASEHRPDKPAGEQRDSEQHKDEAADKADKWRRATAATPALWWE
jgi:hypothetical protein